MRHHLRDILILASGCAAAAVLLWSGLSTRPDPVSLFPGSVSSLEQLAGFGAAAAGLAVALWWVLGLILAILSAVLQKAGHAAAAAAAGALAPAFMKRLAAAFLGINLVAGAGSASASASAADQFPGAVEGQSVSLLRHPLDTGVHPEWEPTVDLSGRGAGPAAADEGADPGAPAAPQWRPTPQHPSTNVFIRPGRSGAAGQTVVVRAGDSLWRLAAEQLGPLAADADIAAHWPRWYERNRGVIGADPHLIIPGQVLEAPEPPPGP